MVQRGEFDAGTALLRSGISTHVRSGWMIRNAEFAGVLAEGLAGLMQTAEAMATVELALDQSSRDRRRWCIPDLLRIKGELLLQQGHGDAVRIAKATLSAAVSTAQTQGALLWELKAGLSQGRLMAAQGHREEAIAILTPLCERLTEGHDTPDVRTAVGLLRLLA